jgi:5-formyltetrahydrofolate cyclo-ligase
LCAGKLHSEGQSHSKTAATSSVVECEAVAPAGADLDALRIRAKRQLRDRARALRTAIPEPAREARSLRVVERVFELPEVQAASAVASFWPMTSRGEVDLRTLDERLRAAGKRLFYPGMAEPDGPGPRFARVDDRAALADRGRRFLEPPADAPVANPGDLDIVIVPALAVSGTGDRLGYGAGFYDSILPRFCPPALSVVVVYDFELLPELPVTDHDVSCNVVVTDTRVIRVAGRP